MNSLIAVAGIVLAWVCTKRIAHADGSFLRLLAWFFFMLASVIMTCYFLRFAAGNTWPSIRPVLSDIIQVGDWLWFFLLGFVALMMGRKAMRFPETEVKMLAIVRWAVVIRIAGFFVFVTLGKYRHLGEMITFFTSSGYSESFLYVIMTLECIGVCGIILDDHLHTGLAAAAGLLMLMAGAVITHVRNGDPLLDSDDAFRQITGLVFLMVILYRERRMRGQRPAAPF